MKRIIRKGTVLSALVFVLAGVISCEKDFTDLGTSIVSNTKFNAKDTVLEVLITQKDIDALRGDNITTGNIGDFLLGVYQDPDKNYEKIEASFVSQLVLASGININDGVTDTTAVTSIFDNAFIKLPYIATRGTDVSNGKPNFTLDSVFGNSTLGVSLKVYQNNTFLNTLNPQNPAISNAFKTDFVFEKGTLLNENPNFKFIPNRNDTVYYYNRTLKNGNIIQDSLKLNNENPFLVIPLNKAIMKSLFFDQFESSSFESQEALVNYFRGIIIEASGNENVLVPFTTSPNLVPSLEINYTNTVFKTADNVVTDTIHKTASFPLSGVKSRIYKMTPESASTASDQTIIQGTAGKEAEVKILLGNQLEELRAKNWLINDATLTFYVDQSRDTTRIPDRLFLYKEEPSYTSQIKDTYTAAFGLNVFSGILVKNGTVKESYNFIITDYISDVLGPERIKNSPLRLKVFNTTDNPIQNNAIDTLFTNYSWNPRAVTIKNHLPANGVFEGTKKARLKISYTEKIN